MEIKEKIKQFVNGADPWGLIGMGAPEDEYNSHIDQIVSFVVNKKPSRLDLELKLYKIFGLEESELDKGVIKELATKIISVGVN